MNVTNTNSNSTHFHRVFSLRKWTLLVATVCMLIPFATIAQKGLTDELPRHYVTSNISLQPTDQKAKNRPAVITETINQNGATW